MQAISRSRLSVVLLAFLLAMAGAMVPFGSVANAASADTTCQSTEGGGHECVLVISSPESVAAGEPFTVTVAVMTGFEGGSVARSDPCGSKAQIELDVLAGETTQNSYFATASGGIATFSVTLSPAGSYQLYAHQPFSEAAATTSASCNNYFYSPDTAQVNAVFVEAGQPIAPCPPDVSCTQVTNNDSGGGSAATLYAANGSFEAAFGPYDPAGLCSLPPADPNNGVLSFTLLDSDASKTVIFALSANLITQGIGKYNICWRSATEFTQLGGTPAPASTSGGFVGQLPNCKTKDDTGPCVLFRTSGQGNVGFFGVNAPPGDPQAYPEAPPGL